MPDAPLMLSVSGLRGLIGKSLTPVVASRYGSAFGEWLKLEKKKTAISGPPHVVVGRDSRPSGTMIEMAAASGLLAVGCKVTLLGIVTTPTVGIMAERLGADGGMVLTASHNPIIWNGIKAIRHDGVAPPPEQARDIIQRFHGDSYEFVPVESIQSIGRDDSSHQVHVDRVLANIDVDRIRRRKFRVVLDSVCGAGGPAGAMLLKELGVELIHLNAETTGLFPHIPEPTRENLVDVSAQVGRLGADIAFAQDPDADRLAIIDENGVYVGEECSLALCAEEVLASPAGRGGTVVANLSTSRMVDDIALAHEGRVVRTPVGEASVAAAMRKLGAVIGGEGNGGVIWPKVIHVRDSLSGMALVLQLMARTNQPLSSLVAGLSKYSIIKDKIDLQPGMGEKVKTVLVEKFKSQKLDTQDGVRIDWPTSWVHARLSNTEPIMRIIAEAQTQAEARDLVRQVRIALDLPV